ncbi:hypothetical protein [Clostridium sp. Ade.TY]|uniref:hypothetical protein n=1 Tax=Clostridium sp. Ade.TY TaxID=1391647 RepID=UPI00041BFA8D|nr:hypothetical protein [Clostridium sp. Ade.TY]
MKINIDENAKLALKQLIENSSDDYVRIKAELACGSSYYNLFMDFKKENDKIVIIDGIKFIFDEYSEKACNDIIIMYDKDVYIKGFYIKENKCNI